MAFVDILNVVANPGTKPATILTLLPVLQKAANADDATSAQADAFLGHCESYTTGHHLAAIQILRGMVRKVGDGRPQGFPQLHAPTIACQALQRVFDPSSLAQKNTETCGPASFVIDMCRVRPAVYAHALVDLVLFGKTQIHDLPVAPRSSICNRALLGLPVAQADWVMLASIRDSMSGLNLDGFISLFKDIDQFGIAPGTLYEWLVRSGYGAVTLIGVETIGDALTSSFKRKVTGDVPAAAQQFAITPEGAARLAEYGSDRGWSVFLFVDDKLSAALNSGTTNFEMRYMAGLEQRANVLSQEATSQQKGRDALTGDTKGGHVMLVAELKIGMYVSLTAFNRGKLVFHHTLPKAAFFSNVRCVIAASDADD
jgi:hypothetical protein